ncbi:hypothetical protein LUZ63_020599 [Rhynchospora breviuscula]|uniref:Pyridoxal-dependent decarboxylase n=1 Tax=Rhynchospora breviuscula TaxID=2022672 RepID=A0A9P9Z9Q7_9POAL|nr:hypothetical protein LUZ63_020599 [Rhynchospora breviuscula]
MSRDHGARRPLTPVAPGSSPARPAPDQALLNAGSTQTLVAGVDAAVRVAADAVRCARGPSTGPDPAHLERLVAAADLDAPLGGLDRALAELGPLYLDDAVWFHHPRYVAHLNCPVSVPAVAADVIASTVNSSMDTWDQSAGATMIERRLVRWTADRLGLGPRADGVFTSGGTASNLQALLLARDHTLTLCGETVGSPALHRLRVLTSADGHFSVVKAASLLGLGGDAVVSVPVDEHRRMDPEALSRALTRLRAEDLVPMAVVATAGTTDFGAIDPLDAIAGLCRAHGAWMHVDAAYGGGLLASPAYADRLRGTSAADSVTVDFHKTWFQPVASSVVVVRERRTLRHATYHADYLNPVDADPEEKPNQVDKSLQTTRRFDALKLWLTLRTTGADAIGAMFDTCIDLAAAAAAAYRSRPGVEVLLDPPLSTVVFRVRPVGVVDGALLDRANDGARDRLFASGEGAVAATRVDGRRWLKLTLLNPATTLADLEHVVGLLEQHADDVVAEASGAAREAS